MRLSGPARFSVIAAAVLMLLVLTPSASLVQDICAGSPTANGIIAPSPILGTGTAGVTQVVEYASLIMLSIVLVMAALYMVGQVIGQHSLQNFLKVELAEMFGTAVIIAIFFGGFFAASFVAVSTPTSAALGSTATPNLKFQGPGRSVFVADCEMISGVSIALIPPILASGAVNFGLNLVDSMSLKITPGGWGFAVRPLQGMDLITRTMTQLSQIVSTFLVALLALNFLLGLIYALFPLFLYLGIVFRAFPWTRAAGGIFIAMFIGFYIVFPLMINATVGGFSTANYNETYRAYYNSPSAAGIANIVNLNASYNSIGTLGQQASIFSSGVGVLGYLGGVLAGSAGFPNNYGVVNGYIADFMGPPIMVIIEIAFSFIVALDFADILSDILGAPSLSTHRLLGKMV